MSVFLVFLGLEMTENPIMIKDSITLCLAGGREQVLIKYNQGFLQLSDIGGQHDLHLRNTGVSMRL